MDSRYETRTETDPEMGKVTARRRQRRAGRTDGGGFHIVTQRLLAELVALDLPASSIALVLETLRQFRMNKKSFRLSTVSSRALGMDNRSRRRWALNRLSGCGLVTVKTDNGRAAELAVTDRLLQLAGEERGRHG
jgi:hypothetical protein